MNGDSGSPDDFHSGQHLTADMLSEVVDDVLTPERRRDLDLHLTSCSECRNTLADMMAIRSVLGQLPLAPVPRSFQIGLEHSRSALPGWTRLANWLMPMLPAMRASTLALAIALCGVTAARLTQDSPNSSRSVVPESTIASAATESTNDVMLAGATDPTTTEPAVPPVSADRDVEAYGQAPGVSTTVDAPAAESTGPLTKTDQPEFDQPTSELPSDDSANADASGAAESAPVDEAGDAAAPDQSGGGSDAIEQSEAEESSDAGNSSETIAMEMAASPTMMPTVTATVTATSSPTQTATASPAPVATSTIAAEPIVQATAEENDDRTVTRLQAVLAILLAAMGAAVIGVSRLGQRSERRR